MTEKEWLASADWNSMLGLVCASERKWRLFKCACVSQLLPLAKLVPDQVRIGLEQTERWADGLITKAAVMRVREQMREARASTPSVRTTADDFVCYAVEYATREGGSFKAIDYSAQIWGWGSKERAPLPHPNLIRDIFGNPFRSVAFSQEWRTDTVVTLARQMYDSREFGAMPILADALQDAGCDSDEILSHCRGPGPHVRGCWVVDLVLGKE